MRAANRSAPPRRRLFAFLVLLFGLILAGSATSVWAGPGAEPPPSEPIAIVKLPFAGIASEVENSLQELLRSTLNRSGFTVLPAQMVGNRLANESRLFGCSTASCYGRLAQVLGVRRVIEGEVQKLGLEFSLQLWVRDLYTGKLVAPPAKEVCQVCSSEEIRQTVIRVAQMLVQFAPPQGPQATIRAEESGLLSLETDPVGARIFIDKVERSERTPATLLLGAGIHDLMIDGTGYEPQRHKVELSSGKQVSLSFVLSPKTQRKTWLRPLGWTSAVLAVGLAVGSGVLFYYHNRPVTSMDCPDQPGLPFHCPQKYDNLGAGIGAAVGAGVLAIGAGIAFYYDLSAPRRRSIAEAESEAAQERPASPIPAGPSPSSTGAPLPTPSPATPPLAPKAPAATPPTTSAAPPAASPASPAFPA
ncbi:MAG TPA: PEGA domain-containing protein, partial [Pseudomonadota bacterium]|nr:PEGA domain-containing protein [Pseudomonadota bacterium]